MTVITEDSIRRLAGFRSAGAPVVSCYLDVDGRRLARTQDVEGELDRALRPAREQGDARIVADLRRIEDHVRGGLDRSRTRGLALFSCQDPPLWQVVDLPVPVRSRVVVNTTPAVQQLEAVTQELERFGVLLVDRQRARMFVFQFGELVDRSELFDEIPRDYDELGERDQSGYDKALHHVEELVARHLRQAGDAAFRLFREDGFERLVIGGPDEITGAVEASLHPYLRERLSGRIRVGVAASLDEVRSAAIEAEAQVERDKEAEAVDRLRDAVASGGRGVAGLDDTLRALVERRVDVLFVSDGYGETGWRCPSCGYLCHRGPRCPVDGREMDKVADIVEEAIDEALGQSCRVEVCAGNADLDVLGRIGALLRY
jgi:peptide chain release factor subunit 1